MKKVYLDRTNDKECMSLFYKDAEVVFAGTTITAMPKKDYNEEYKRFSDQYDMNFLFDDCVPMIDFYAVPQFDIFATDGEGGYIGTIGNASDFECDNPIGYIDKNKDCFLIAACGKDFLKNAADWRAQKLRYEGIRIFGCKKEAQDRFDFVEIPKSCQEAL